MIRPRQADSQIKEFRKKLEVYSNGAISAIWIILPQNHKLEENFNFRKFMIRPRQADSQIKEFRKKLEV